MAQQALPNFFLGNITKGNSFEVLPLNWCVYQHQHQLLVKYQESVIATSSLFFWCFLQYINHCVTKVRNIIFSTTARG